MESFLDIAPLGVGSSRSVNAPLDLQHIAGRIIGNDWTIANVATLLRFNASQSTLRSGPLTSSQRQINQDYLRKTSAHHLSSGVTVAFRRDETSVWYAELSFVGPQAWNEAVAEEWLAALFLQQRPNVRESRKAGPQPEGVRRFELSPATEPPFNLDIRSSSTR